MEFNRKAFALNYNRWIDLLIIKLVGSKLIRKIIENLHFCV